MIPIQVRKIMEDLRAKAKIIRSNNQKVSDWIDVYFTECFIAGRPINILSQWCLSKAFEKRLIEQGGTFKATKKEKRVLQEEIPAIINLFSKNGFRVNWLVTFNRSYLDNRQLPEVIEKKYKDMVVSIAQAPEIEQSVLFLDWEKDILGQKSKPNNQMISNPEEFIEEGLLSTEVERWKNWAEQEAGLDQPIEQIKKDAIYQIAYEAEEGKFLMGDQSPFNSEKFVIIPLEVPERFDTFSIFSPDIKKRILPILSFYPWRMKLLI